MAMRGKCPAARVLIAAVRWRAEGAIVERECSPLVTGSARYASRHARIGAPQRGIRALENVRARPYSLRKPIEYKEASRMTTAPETRKFEAEVAQVLHLVTHSLYSAQGNLPARAHFECVRCVRQAALRGAGQARASRRRVGSAHRYQCRCGSAHADDSRQRHRVMSARRSCREYRHDREFPVRANSSRRCPRSRRPMRT